MRTEAHPQNSEAMAVGKAAAIAAAILGAVMLAGVRGDVNSRAESTMPLEMSHVVKHLKPFTNDGVANETMAEGFQTVEDFAATVHASRNVRVPFTTLKHQVVEERQTLAAAIHTVKPTANASLEADLARSEARADLDAIK
jgi:hypothetical protein